MIDAATLITGLGGNHDTGICLCPAHDDHDPSLQVTQKGDKVLVKCWAGCSQDAVIDTLRAKGLWPTKGFAQSRKKTRRREEPDAEFERFEKGNANA